MYSPYYYWCPSAAYHQHFPSFLPPAEIDSSNYPEEEYHSDFLYSSDERVLHNNGMSLFQDLKLKRRKVDSRCSSDGESIGTSDSAASLSPDAQAQGEASPKDKDRCTTPEECGGDLSKAGFPPDAFIFMIKAERERAAAALKEAAKVSSLPLQLKPNSVIKLTPNGMSHMNGHDPPLVIVKSEPNDDDGTKMNGLSLSCRREGTLPEKRSIMTNCDHPSVVNSPGGSPRPRKSPLSRSLTSRPNSSAGSDNESIGSRSSCKSEKKLIVDEDMCCNNSPPPLITRLGDPASPPGQNSNSNSSSTSGVGLSPQSSNSGSSSVIFTKHHQGQRLSPNNSSSVPSPLHHHPHLHNLMGGHPMVSHQSHLHARLTTGPPPDPRSAHRDPSSPLVQAELRNMVEKADPLSVVTSTSLSFHHHSMYRINGVRPEVISGGAVTPTCNTSPNGSNTGSPPSHHHHQQMNGGGQVNRKSPTHPSRSPNGSPQSNSGSSLSSLMGNGSIHSPGSNGSNTLIGGGGIPMSTTNGTGGGNHHHVNLNRTPTVIMGEAGGVRTMLWSQNLPSDLGIGPNGNSPPSNGHHYGLPPLGNGMVPNGHISPPHQQHNNPLAHHPKGGLSMERLWASEALNLSTGPGSNTSTNTTNSKSSSGSSPPQNGHYQHHHITNSNHPEEEESEQPMICMICEDRATGLHYGIITCEGCKGFFKRTVQNRRVYTCVADGTCEITKAQRNRCQYCRFKKCIEQGMVLQAVREDRMPGGRNSGAVYNLYKVPVKYRKHKKGNRGVGGGVKGEKMNSPNNGVLNCHSPNSNGLSQGPLPPPMNQSSLAGTILKAALTSPNEVSHMRQGIHFDQAAGMITHLVQCDNFHDIAALQNWEELLEGGGDLSEKLCQMGDSIVYRLVQWTKRLPFYQEVPVEVHTRVLTHKWHELLVLTTSAWQAMHTPGPPTSLTAEEETMENIQILQRCLQAMMGRSLTLEQLRQDVGQMVERLTYLTRSFRRLGIRLEEYVTLKVIAMLQNTGTKSTEVAVIQERYIKCLRTFLEVTCPSHPNRLNELLRTLPEVQSAASLLLESKMFYVPFLLNSALLQR